MVDVTIERSVRQIRVLRCVGASTAATLVALASHVAAGGTPPPALLVLAVCVLSWLPGLLLIGRRTSLLGQAATILTAEVVLHVTFALAAGPGAASLVPSGGAAMRGMPGMAAPPIRAMSPMSMPSAGMWVAHGVAALITVLAWNRGEAAFWGLVRVGERLSRTVLADVVTAIPLARPLARPEPRSFDQPPALHLRRALAASPRRGPPLPPQF